MDKGRMTPLRLLPLAAALLIAPAVPFALAAPAAAQAPAASEAQRFKTFLDAEFDAYLTSNPQAATQLGSKVGYDRLNDQSEAAELQDCSGGAAAWRG
jgi:hypothetical protein